MRGACAYSSHLSTEKWPSGRRHFPAKEAYGLKPVSRVRIPLSPPDSASVAQLDRVSGYEPEGRAFESLRMRQMSPSSRGLGHRPFTAITGVRIPVGTPLIRQKSLRFAKAFLRLYSPVFRPIFCGNALPMAQSAPPDVIPPRSLLNLYSLKTRPCCTAIQHKNPLKTLLPACANHDVSVMIDVCR